MASLPSSKRIHALPLPSYGRPHGERGVAAGDTDAFRALRLDAAPQVPGPTRRPGRECGRSRLGQAQVRSSPASTETAKAAPPNRWRHDEHGHEDGHAVACAGCRPSGTRTRSG